MAPGPIMYGLDFFLSAQTAKESNQLSKNIAQSTIIAGERIGIVAPGDGKSEGHLSRWNNLLRDCAHAAVFFVLALTVSNAVRESGLEGVKKYLFVFLFCGLYAVLDEFHQSFVPRRGAQVSDFFRDCGGVILGMVICSLISNKCKQIRVMDGSNQTESKRTISDGLKDFINNDCWKIFKKVCGPLFELLGFFRNEGKIYWW